MEVIKFTSFAFPKVKCHKMSNRKGDYNHYIFMMKSHFRSFIHKSHILIGFRSNKFSQKMYCFRKNQIWISLYRISVL